MSLEDKIQVSISDRHALALICIHFFHQLMQRFIPSFHITHEHLDGPHPVDRNRLELACEATSP